MFCAARLASACKLKPSSPHAEKGAKRQRIASCGAPVQEAMQRALLAFESSAPRVQHAARNILSRVLGSLIRDPGDSKVRRFELSDKHVEHHLFRTEASLQTLKISRQVLRA